LSVANVNRAFECKIVPGFVREQVIELTYTVKSSKIMVKPRKWMVELIKQESAK
jgi:hypothetical protein